MEFVLTIVNTNPDLLALWSSLGAAYCRLFGDFQQFIDCWRLDRFRTFTLFNRLAALKVMEDRELFPEVIRRRVEHGNLSYAHKQWLEEHTNERNAERMGLKHFL